jgi:hypothetical protein
MKRWADLKRGDIIRYKGKVLKFLSRSNDHWHFRTGCGKPASIRWDPATKQEFEPLGDMLMYDTEA